MPGAASTTVLIDRQKFPGQPANLDALCRRFNIDLSGRSKHGALLDAELLADVYLELRGGRQATLGLVAGNACGAVEITTATATDIPRRHFPPSLEELAAHAVVLEKIPDALWKLLAG